MKSRRFLKSIKIEIWLLLIWLGTLAITGIAATIFGGKTLSGGNWTGIIWIFVLGLGTAIMVGLAKRIGRKLLFGSLYLVLTIPTSFAIWYNIGCGTYGDCL